MSDSRPQISRRRLIVGTGAGAAALWAAPAITTLGTAAGATGSSCSVFRFFMPNLSSPAASPSSAITGSVTAGDTVFVGTGNVDFTGAGTDYSGPPWTTTLAMDLDGTTAGLTILTGPNLTLKTYTVEIEGFGALASGNSVSVEIGGTPVITPQSPPDGSSNPWSFTGTALASGALTLTHSGPGDNQGLFLSRLEVFANCV